MVQSETYLCVMNNLESILFSERVRQMEKYLWQYLIIIRLALEIFTLVLQVTNGFVIEQN
jgi:hypothetical protein